ncbi:TELO2-interacting protein 1 homolog isoform X2 [Strongylocentrotus purpuratus]|uniref:TELO2-interacting protein 1 homolog n=1 Tax=Strongylocentrotus purpuratus TaxID=7668 RepID=A0A7M7NX61_STRPU|nr:TELO2-interacting protein 1 homolog isoform X2 [Strongylocentrotus purpuratus]
MSKSSAFECLRPLCVVLMKEQTLESIQAVARSIQDLDTESLQALQQYVLFPLRILLKNQSKLSTGVCEAGVLCMQSILEKTTLVNWEMFSDIFTALCVTISSKQSNGQASDGSEELKLAVVKALTAMLKSADPAIILQLMSPQSLPMLGHCISLLLNLSEAEKMKELQVAALKCLTSFVPDDDASLVYGEASKCFASFLPGLSVTISRVILANPKQGQNAIECWSKHISMVMDDRLLPLDKTKKSEDVTKRQLLQDGEESLLVSKTETWLTGTASKLDILIAKIVTMVTSRSWRVRLALVRFAETLILRTKSSMSCSMGKVLEVLVSLAQDRYDQVSSPSQAILRSMAKESLTVESRMLSELLEDNLHKLVTVLPRIIRTADDEEKLSTVTAMVGYVKLLGHRLNSLLNSAPHLKRLSIALLQALELSIRDTGILETTPAPQADLSGGEVRRGHSRDFKHFSDHKIYEGIFQLCQLLGQYGNVSLLIDNFLSYFHESPSYVKQATMIMNEIMQGTLLVANDDQLSIWQEKETEEEEKIEDALKIEDAEELKSIVSMLLDEYLSPSCWDVPTTQSSSPPSTAPLSSSASSSSLSWQPSAPPTHLILRNASSSSSSSRDALTVSQMNHNTLLKCILLDGIAVFAQVLGAQFNQLLMHCLYLVLERMADERTLVCQHAHATLAIISQACGYRSISELLLMNVDYLSDSVSARLRHYEWNLKAPLVLKVTLQHSTCDILPLLQDTIEEVFHLMDDHHGDHATSLMSVLQSLVLAINRWFPPSREEEVCTEVLSCESDQVSSIVAFCNDYIQTLNKADEDLKNLDVEMDPENTDEVEDEEKWMDEVDKPKELPLHIKNVKQVLEHCVNLMSSSNPRLRLQVLSTVQSAVEALHQNQDVLLPLVHKLWPAFVLRFADQEILVTCKAFETLLTLAETSRDFIRRRVVKDVWPKLTSFVQTHAAMSEKAGSSYHHTAYYKLQHSILAGIGQLCLQVDICEADLLVMVQACIPYLNACQPVGLQEACISAFEGFIAAEPDAVWFSLLDISSSSSLQPPHPCFPSIKFAGDSSKQNTQQWSNIEKLLR